ncbi:MAG: AmmeMemoRadiSam system protein B [Candidatus Omnitrophica bacterium]|nr:AmmeMemoRadiSam system protein B [Candidatus Omnitrophota bacterium]
MTHNKTVREMMKTTSINKVILLVLFVLFFEGQNGSAGETKKADLAGSWYPADKKELRTLLGGFIDGVVSPGIEGKIFGLILPHAGYDYSGRTAGIGFKAVKGKDYKTIVIVGFSHRKFFEGVSVYDKGSFQTPLGTIEVDTEFAKNLINQHKNILFYPPLFNDENSIEMLIPFVQVALKDSKIVPVAFGSQDYRLCEILARALADVIKTREDVLIIASTDMSHFHTYEEANEIDNFTLEKIKRFQPKELYDEVTMGTCELCGSAPVITLMMVMKILGVDNVKILKYENSGDVTGDRRRVVGYVSAVFYKSAASKKEEMNMLTEKQKKRLLEIARQTIEEYVKSGKVLEFTETDVELLKEKGAFVTLHYRGGLRGCIGNIIGKGPLYKTVRDMAIESSTNDPRFPPVESRELKDIKVEISVLSEPERVTDVNKIIMGKHGVIVKRGFRSGVFLPQVATETGWSREEFLNNLCSHKAGLSPDAWKDPQTEIYSFIAEVFGEE